MAQADWPIRRRCGVFWAMKRLRYAALLVGTAVSGNIDDAQLALWHYFRWQIETFFKLLKGVGYAREMGGSGREAPFF